MTQNMQTFLYFHSHVKQLNQPTKKEKVRNVIKYKNILLRNEYFPTSLSFKVPCLYLFVNMKRNVIYACVCVKEKR